MGRVLRRRQPRGRGDRHGLRQHHLGRGDRRRRPGARPARHPGGRLPPGGPDADAGLPLLGVRPVRGLDGDRLRGSGGRALAGDGVHQRPDVRLELGREPRSAGGRPLLPDLHRRDPGGGAAHPVRRRSAQADPVLDGDQRARAAVRRPPLPAADERPQAAGQARQRLDLELRHHPDPGGRDRPRRGLDPADVPGGADEEEAAGRAGAGPRPPRQAGGRPRRDQDGAGRRPRARAARGEAAADRSASRWAPPSWRGVSIRGSSTG